MLSIAWQRQFGEVTERIGVPEQHHVSSLQQHGKYIYLHDLSVVVTRQEEQWPILAYLHWMNSARHKEPSAIV